MVSIEIIFDNGLISNIINNKNISRICCTYSLALYQLLRGFQLIENCSLNIKENNFSADGKVYNVEINDRIIDIILLYPATRSYHSGKLKDE